MEPKFRPQVASALNLLRGLKTAPATPENARLIERCCGTVENEVARLRAFAELKEGRVKEAMETGIITKLEEAYVNVH